MKVAKSYQNYIFDETKAYEKNGKKYVMATCECDRCVKGMYISRVENGRPVPHPAYGGVCLKCNGTGYIQKEIRLYTDEEFEKAEKANLKAAEKRASAKEEKMKAEYANKRSQWLIENGFNDDLVTYVYFPADSYDVKEELKEVGFKFHPVTLWHIAEIPAEYKDKCIAISLDDVAEIGAWGTGNYKPNSEKFVKDKVNAIRPASASEWIGEEKEKFINLPVKLVSIHGFETRYGYSQVVKFLYNENVIVWFTAVDIKFEVGDNLLLSGTIKKLDEYNGVKQTIITRCKMHEAE